MLMRGIPEKNAVVHRGGWNKSAKDSYEVRGKTMGIVGYGSIGSQLSVLAESLGMKVIYHDAMTKLPLGNATQVGSLEELLSKADVVTLHVPDSSSTRNIMTAKAFEQMKDGSFSSTLLVAAVWTLMHWRQRLRAKKFLVQQLMFSKRAKISR